VASRFEYYLREVTSGLRRNGLVAFAAVTTTFIALLLFGLALLISRETNIIIQDTTGNVEVAVYLSDPVSSQTVQDLTGKLTNLPVVSSVHYETKAEACARYQKMFKSQPALVRTVNCSALPASLRVKLSDPERFREVAAVLGCEENKATGRYDCASPGIENLVDQRQFLDRLFSVTRVFRVGVLLVSVVMLVAAAILIANTVRMGLFARRKEIGIMKLVGATNWRIRIPFLMEGLFESLIGAGAAVLALFALKVAFINPLYGKIQFIRWVTNADVVAIIPWLVIAGVFVALVAGLAGMRRFLEV
jgi:cell division transport system permease protein